MNHQMRRVFAGLVCLVAALPMAASLSTTGERAIASTGHDTTPVVFSQVRSGVEHQASVWMQYGSGGTLLRYDHVPGPHGGTVPQQSGYAQYADPQLAEYESNQRIYLVGQAHNGAEGSANAILRWYSDDGGASWSTPLAVVEYASGTISHYVSDPSVAVSPGGITPGYVYVLHTSKSNSSGLYQLLLSVSTNGGASFLGPYAVNSPSEFLPVGRVVADANGDVYVVWEVFHDTTDQLYVAKSPGYDSYAGMNFGTAVSQAAGTLRESVLNCGAGCAVTARSILSVKIDSPHYRIGVAWHSLSGSATVVNYRSIGIGPGTPWWQTGTVFPNNGSFHHLQPALDFDAAGGVLVSYYNFANYSSTYTNQARYLTFAGTTPMMEATVHSFSGNANDVTATPVVEGVFTRTLGKYHDVHFSNGTFKTIGIEVRSSASDPYVFTTIHY